MKKINPLKNIYIGIIIEQKFLESAMTIQNFAKKIHLDRTTVYDIFKRKTIDTERLLLISQALNFDFINEVYFEKEILPEKPQKKFIALEIDEESFQKLNLPDDFLKFVQKP
jgi:hypothetical protein